MACDEHVVERVRVALRGRRGIAERRMFGGVCFALNGHMVCGVIGDDLVVRIGPDRYEDALKRPHVREMDFTGRPMRGYVFVGSPGFSGEPSLQRWVELGVAFVGRLPPKPPKRA